jgi:peptidyl-prolyl cis-trans isomerase C
LLWSCVERVVPTAPDTVVQLDGESWSWDDFVASLERSVGDDAEALESEVLSALVDQFVEERLILRLARDRELIGEDESAPRRALRALLEAEGDVEIPEEELANYYRDHRDEFVLDERVELHQILVEERELAEQARDEVEAGADFEEVARRLSIDPTAEWGGYQGDLSRGDLPPALAEVIFSLDEGEMSDIVEADFRYHLFWVRQRIPKRVVSLEEAEPRIRERLLTRAADRRVSSLIREARERYNVRIVESNLPFEYTPAEASRDS